jgi:hypothetical protein
VWVSDDEHERAPTPGDQPLTLPGPQMPTPSLQELLEHSSRVQAASFGSGMLVGECLDTHHPHLPRRILVRVRDESGTPISAWLPTLAELRVRPGNKLLLGKPDNWPEPVVLGVLGGVDALASGPDSSARPGPATEPEPSDPQLRLGQGETLQVTGPEGQLLLTLTATATGPVVTLLQSNVAIDMPGVVRIGADRIELVAREGGVDIRADGDTVVRSRTIRLN